MSLSSIVKSLLIEEPFYGLLLIGLNKKFGEDVDTAGVYIYNAVNMGLVINPTYWNSLERNHKYGLLKHELLHIALFHLELRDSFPDKKLFNLAADLVINQYIKSNRLHSTWILYEHYKDIPGIETFKSTKFYYDLFQQNKDHPKIASYLQGEDVHVNWDSFELSNTQKELMKSGIDRALKDTLEANKGRMPGNMPGKLRKILSFLIEAKPPIINWKQYLRRFTSSSPNVFLKKSRRKPSKRFPDMAGNKIQRKKKVLVAIDTSGSVQDAELRLFFAEIMNIKKSGVEIDILECDARIGRVYSLKNIPDTKITGGGGTSFQPVIEYIRDNKGVYTSAVYFTDGYASTPTIKPNIPLLWLITPGGKGSTDLPGKVLQFTK